MSAPHFSDFPVTESRQHKMADNKFDETTQVLRIFCMRSIYLNSLFRKSWQNSLKGNKHKYASSLTISSSSLTIDSISKARMSAQIQSFTIQCWDKCVTGTPSTRFSRSEETCLANCVERFLDTSLFMVKQIEEKRIQSGR